MHRYQYDSDNRITEVETSKDGKIWENDASYFYYSHGPLARTEIGDKKVQGIDYAYTIQGWIKGVNSEELAPAFDMGLDGGTAGTLAHRQNSQVAQDAFGYSLSYFEGDYAARISGADNFLRYSKNLPSSSANLYNGNIRDMYTAIMKDDFSHFLITKMQIEHPSWVLGTEALHKYIEKVQIGYLQGQEYYLDGKIVYTESIEELENNYNDSFFQSLVKEYEGNADFHNKTFAKNRRKYDIKQVYERQKETLSKAKE